MKHVEKLDQWMSVWFEVQRNRVLGIAKGSKKRPKTNTPKDYASQIVEKQETIASLNTEIASITGNIDSLKVNLKEKKTALKKVQKEVATLEAKKAKADAKALKKQRRLKPRVRLRDY